MTDERRVGAAELRAFTQSVFVAAGLPSEDAALEAEVLVWANLRGVDSHGVLRIPWYVELLDRGDMNPRPRIRIERETAATLLVDGDRAFGPVVTTFAMRRAMDKARAAGIGWALIRNTTHQGAMAYYALMAAEAGMAGLAIVCSPPNMAPHGARAAAEYVVHGQYLKDDEGLPPARGQEYVLPGGAFFDIRGERIARVSNYYNLQDWIAQVSR